MSNQIDLIYAKQVETQVKLMRTELAETLDTAIKLSNLKIELFNSKTPTSPSGMKKAIDESNALAAATDKNTIKILKSLEQETKARQALDKQRQKAIAENEKSLQREQVALAKSESLYGAVRAKMALLTLEYNELATKKSLGAKLTDDESKRYAFLTTKIQGYYKVLDTVNTNIGKFQQRVGQYGGSFNPLTNSVGRLAQELPNLGQSFQIFAMSIGNNIAAFKDAIDDIRANNKVLQAEGKATSSVMSQVGASLFSLNTLLYVGIAVFIAYGKEIGDWASSLFGANEIVKDIAENQEKLNKSRLEGSKNAISPVDELNKYLKIAADVTAGDDKRAVAIERLRALYIGFSKTMTDQNFLNGETIKFQKDVTAALINRADAEEKVNLIQENKKKIKDLEFELIANEKILKIRKESVDNLSKKEFVNGQALAAESDRYAESLEKRNKIQRNINAYVTQNLKYQDQIYELQKASILLEDKQDKKNKTKKVKREDIEALDLSGLKPVGGNALLAVLEAQLAAVKLEQEAVSRGSAEWAKYQKQVDFTTLAIKRLKEGFLANDPVYDETGKRIKKIVVSAKELEEGVLLLKKTMQDWSFSFTSGVFSEAGLPTLFSILNDEILGFGSNAQVTAIATMEAFQEMYNFMNKASQENFEQSRADSERKYKTDLLFAGENEAAKAELEKQAEERKRRINKREAKANKELAKFNIVANAAQGIVAAFKDGEVIKGAIFAAFIAGIAAVQLSQLNSANVPEFWKGTDNAPSGLAWTQEKGREIITDKHGKIKSTGSDKGAQLTTLAKGDKVYTAEQTRQLMFDNGLNGIMSTNQILPPKNNDFPIDEFRAIGDRMEAAAGRVANITFQTNNDSLGNIISVVANGTASANARKTLTPQKFQR